MRRPVRSQQAASTILIMPKPKEISVDKGPGPGGHMQEMKCDYFLYEKTWYLLRTDQSNSAQE